LSFINGVDVSNLTQNFTDKEWRKLAYNGRQSYVAAVCAKLRIDESA
jgi:hypothetical protein